MKHFLQHLRDLGGMGVASAGATFLDWLVFLTMVRLVDAPLAYSAALGAAAGALLHYSLCHLWVFGRFERRVLQSAPRYVLVSGIALVLHTLLVTGLAHHGVATDLAWLISKVSVFTLWCYPASRYLVFGQPAQSA